MTRKINVLCALMLLLFVSSNVAFAQKKNKKKGEEGYNMPENYLSPEVAKDKDQTEDWKMAKAKYPSKPKDMVEIGINVGHFFIAGDVRPEFGWGVGASIRKSLGYSFALRWDASYRQARGLNTGANTVAQSRNEVLAPLYTGEKWYANHKTQYIKGTMEGVLTLNNLLFHKERTKWDFFLFAGLGLGVNRTYYDALNATGNVYDFSDVAAPGDNNDARKETRSNLKDKLDRDYETSAERWRGLFRLFDSSEEPKDDAFGVDVIANVGAGIGYRVNKRVSISLEHEVILTDNDLLDGYRWSEQGDLTRDTDVPQYTNLRINFNLGSAKKRVEPLWWMNPLEAPMSDIQQLKQRPIFDTNDDDGDGVVNELDKEPNTAPNCPVDTRGVTLDSDADGVVDCKDKEPYSPPGYDVDAEGVAQLGDEPDWATKQYVDAAIKRIPKPVIPNPVGNVVSARDWFLPMIHFDLDKFAIKPEFYGELHQVATVMKKNPEINVVAYGNTDVRNPNDYNTVLSYKRSEAAINYLVTKYGIPASRFVIKYGGEEDPLIPGLTRGSSDKKHYMNRRVEFRVAEPGDVTMPRPVGPDAGQGTQGF